MTAFSALSHLVCSRTGTHHDADIVQNLSPVGAPLLAAYDLERLAATWRPDDLHGRTASLWRWHELLPVRDPAHVMSLGEGGTPLLPMPRLGQALGIDALWMKDEGIVPTGSFKARGLVMAVSMGKALGMTIVAEGVETSEQREFLRAHACDEMQGFLFSRPLPPRDLAELLKASPVLTSPPLQPSLDGEAIDEAGSDLGRKRAVV